MSNNNRNGIVRPKQVPFTMVSNAAIRDSDLSLGAKGLYCLIQSFITIPNFTLYKNTLKKQCLEGEQAFQTKWNELKEKGWLIQYKIRDHETGQFFYEYELLDEKDTEKNTQQNMKRTGKKPSKPLKKRDSFHTPKTLGVDPSNGGEVGVYNNNDSTNTDSIKSVSQSGVKETDGQTNPQDNAELNRIMDEAQLYLFDANHCRALETALKGLWYSKQRHIQGVLYSQQELRAKIRRLTLDAVDYALCKLRAMDQDRGIKNKAKYLQSVIITAIDEAPAASLI